MPDSMYLTWKSDAQRYVWTRLPYSPKDLHQRLVTQSLSYSDFVFDAASDAERNVSWRVVVAQSGSELPLSAYDGTMPESDAFCAACITPQSETDVLFVAFGEFGEPILLCERCYPVQLFIRGKQVIEPNGVDKPDIYRPVAPNL